jgi:hypothetical protein
MMTALAYRFTHHGHSVEILWLPARAAQHPDRMLAVIASQGHELIQDLDPVTKGCAAIPQSQRLNQLRVLSC